VAPGPKPGMPRRLADLKQLATALELYFNDNNQYPIWTSGCLETPGNPLITGLTTTPPGIFPAFFTDEYMKTIPKDPLPNKYCYFYQSDATGANLKMAAYLEKDTARSLNDGGTEDNYYEVYAGPTGSGTVININDTALNNAMPGYVPPLPTVTLTADPTSITSGGSSTLTWSSTYATACVASVGWSGAKPLSDSGSVSPTITTAYTLTCSNTTGSGESSVEITVSILTTLTLTVPNGGESWGKGETHNITWTSTGSITNVKLEYSSDSFSTANTIITSTSNNGSYSWTIPDISATTIKIRISDVSNPTINDLSNANFAIFNSKRAFITSGTHNGNIVAWATELGVPNSNGLLAGDNVCQYFADHATPSPLGGTWKVWLSSSQGSPSSRFNQVTVKYVNMNGQTIANDWNDLIDGSIQNAISYDENKQTKITGVWAGTTVNGTYATNENNCLGWTTAEQGNYATCGLSGWVDGNWTHQPSRGFGCPSTFSCSSIYCFEQ